MIEASCHLTGIWYIYLLDWSKARIDIQENLEGSQSIRFFQEKSDSILNQIKLLL